MTAEGQATPCLGLVVGPRFPWCQEAGAPWSQDTRQVGTRGIVLPWAPSPASFYGGRRASCGPQLGSRVLGPLG